MFLWFSKSAITILGTNKTAFLTILRNYHFAEFDRVSYLQYTTLPISAPQEIVYKISFKESIFCKNYEFSLNKLLSKVRKFSDKCILFWFLEKTISYITYITDIFGYILGTWNCLCKQFIFAREISGRKFNFKHNLSPFTCSRFILSPFSKCKHYMNVFEHILQPLQKQETGISSIPKPVINRTKLYTQA